MADGTFAALLLIAGLTDMSRNHCGTEAGCFGNSRDTPRLAFSAGEVLKRRANGGSEAYLRYDLGRKTGPFGYAAGVSVGQNGEVWAGFGSTYKVDLGKSAYAELHAMPGLYIEGSGFDLGGPVEFRSGIEFGYENKRGWRFALSYDHRSNMELYDQNPGIETVQLRVSIPLK